MRLPNYKDVLRQLSETNTSKSILQKAMVLTGVAAIMLAYVSIVSLGLTLYNFFILLLLDVLFVIAIQFWPNKQMK